MMMLFQVLPQEKFVANCRELSESCVVPFYNFKLLSLSPLSILPLASFGPKIVHTLAQNHRFPSPSF